MGYLWMAVEAYYSLQVQGTFSSKFPVEEYVGLCYQMMQKLRQDARILIIFKILNKELWNSRCVQVYVKKYNTKIQPYNLNFHNSQAMTYCIDREHYCAMFNSAIYLKLGISETQNFIKVSKGVLLVVPKR